MATTPTDVTSLFVPVTTDPGQPIIQIANPNPPVVGLVAPPAIDFKSVVATIQSVINSDKAANTPGTTNLPAPNNFAFTDLTVNVSNNTPGDAFKGTIPGITAQFIDLTPDNLLIRAISPNVFMRSDTGNDLLLAAGGTNILSAGSGVNSYLAGSGSDFLLADASKASTSETVLNFGSGDNAVITGVSTSDFKFSIKDTPLGMEIDATPVLATNPISAQITLPGFTVADFGTKLSLGLSSNVDGTSFVFLHGN